MLESGEQTVYGGGLVLSQPLGLPFLYEASTNRMLKKSVLNFFNRDLASRTGRTPFFLARNLSLI